MSFSETYNAISNGTQCKGLIPAPYKKEAVIGTQSDSFSFRASLKHTQTIQYSTGWETGVYSLPEIIKSIMTQVCHTAKGKTLSVCVTRIPCQWPLRVSKSLDETWALVVSFEATFAPETFTADYFSFY